MAEKWQEIVADVAIGGAVGSGAQFWADRYKNGTDRQQVFGITGLIAGALGLGLKIWSNEDQRSYPGWKDDVGDPLLVSGATLGGLVGMRMIDRNMQVTQPTTVPAGFIDPTVEAAALSAGYIPAGLVEADPTAGNPGYPVDAAQLQQIETTIPLSYDESTGLWDETVTST